MEKHHAIVKTGMIVDTSTTGDSLYPKRVPTYVVEDWKEEEKKKISQRKARDKKETQSGINIQEKCFKKSGKLYYRDKSHVGEGIKMK
ncbi:MAG: hypothetical protein ACMUEL_00865 [Flavobacteriales bacterium Tduv]